MSLNFDLSKLPSRLIDDEAEYAITDALVWYAMFTGMPGELTAKNAPEFYSRIAISEKVNGAMLRKAGGPYFITYDDVVARIGMKTEVTNIGLSHLANGESRAKWLKRAIGSEMDSIINNAKREFAQKGDANAV